MVEASLLRLRRMPGAAQVCGLVLLQSDVSAAFHAALTLKYSTLFNWPRLTGAEQEEALQLMMRALDPPQQVLQDWAPVRQQALLAIALYWKKGFLEGRQLCPIAQLPLNIAAAICHQIQDEKNLGLLACSNDAHRAAQARFSSELPGLLQRASCEANSSALAACAAWTFPSAPPEGWAISCAQVAFALSSADRWDIALDFAGQHCMENQAMWALVLAAAARPSQRYAAAACMAQLRTEPTAAQALELAKRAAELMKEDFSLEEQLESLDALVKLLEVLSRRSQSLEVQDLLLDHFFPEILARANVPDFYDETLALGSTDRRVSCSDVLQLIAQLTGQRPRIVDGTCHFLAAPLEGHENSLDVKHVALCFAAEVVAVNPQAGATFAGILCTMMQKFESPLLMADSFRFFHRLRFDGLSMSDAEQLLNMTLMGLRQMASDPDVARSGLQILADLGKTPGSFPLFQSHFHGVWADPILPLSVITGFCRSIKAAGETTPAGLQALATPLLEDVLKQLETWDPKIVSGKSLHLTERRFCALAGLAPLDAQMDHLLVEAVQRKLSGQFPEHLLPCAAPLLAALTKAAVRAGNASLNLADQICGAMAAMAANAELQDHTLELCDALLSAGNRCVSGGANACDALALMCQQGLNECHEVRCYELLCRVPRLTPAGFQCLLCRGLGHPNAAIQLLSSRRLAGEKGALVDAMAAQVMSRVLQVALGNSIDGVFGGALHAVHDRHSTHGSCT